MLLRIHICGHDKSVPYGCWRITISLQTDCDNVANTNEMGCEHSARRRGPIHRARILTLSNIHIRITKYVHSHHRTHISTLSNTCFHVIKYVFPFQRTRISTLPNTCFHIIKYTFPHHHTHITVCHFVGVYVYAGAINRTPTAANGLRKCCWRSAIMQRTHREKPTNTNEIHTKHSAKYQQTFREIPTLTHEMGCEHSARRRGPIHRARILTLSNIHIRITKYVHSHHRTHISTLSNTCFRFNAHAFPHYQIRAFTSPHTHFRLSFCGCIRICGHDKSDPYGCERIAKMLLTDCDNVANTNEIHTKHTARYQQTFREKPSA